ncbi:efflux RND transporter periplasmic adaptor subunit [Neolewinella lacunae]|uniref:Efflux RND transporter periplasmic adaptor subunit n=1 Tax=Neolewinella lacunae TaxID=1517758 RepID=A0A923PGS3_9BACT|nr:efflux RND transporter periplasmic adaptor subunit [Neolewinella lacunae]MBC6993833.1 efflux RND transporter periplasmic adaptor subunit [Neolewinella lacunae]MDN3635276.1 efflux RND transporter periplasmic adaptor subunit [Neolewinella lacunae]
MKNIFFSLPLLLMTFLASCGSATQGDEMPADLAGKQELLRTKKAELRALAQEIEALEDTIYALDPSLAPKAALVAYETLEPASFQGFARVQATVTAAETAMATPEIAGRILRMNFAEGDAIRKGQLVAVLDVESITTQRAELETAADLAKTVFERQQRLWEQNLGSEIQYLQAKNNYERVQQQLKSFDVQTSKRNVYAPLSGTVSQVMLRTGESAMPGAPILSILSTNDLDVVADASEDLLSKVKLRQKVKVTVPALNLEFEAPISRIGKTVDPANRTFEVEVDVPSKYLGQLKANLLAEVEVLNFTADQLIVVSQDHIQQEIDGRRYVFTVAEGDDGQVARKTFIETGESYDNRAIITSGLKAGDRVITDGARGLTDGQRVSISQNPIQ